MELKDRTTGEWTTLTVNTALYKGDWIRLLPTPIAGSIRRCGCASLTDRLSEVAWARLRPGQDRKPSDRPGRTAVPSGVLDHPLPISSKTVRSTAGNTPRSLSGADWPTPSSVPPCPVRPGSCANTEEVIEYGLEHVYNAGGLDAPRQRLHNHARTRQRRPSDRRNHVWRHSRRGHDHQGRRLLAVANRVGTTRVVNAAQQTRLLPPRSQIEHTTGFGRISALPYASDTPIGSLALSRPTAKSVDTRTRCAHRRSSSATGALPARSLDLHWRRPGRPVRHPDHGQGSVQVSQQAGLRSGANTIEASVIEVQSGRQSVTGTIYASAPPVAPKRVVAVTGQTRHAAVLAPQPGARPGRIPHLQGGHRSHRHHPADHNPSGRRGCCARRVWPPGPYSPSAPWSPAPKAPNPRPSKALWPVRPQPLPRRWPIWPPPRPLTASA